MEVLVSTSLMSRDSLVNHKQNERQTLPNYAMLSTVSSCSGNINASEL